jgi:hypothetical protein
MLGMLVPTVVNSCLQDRLGWLGALFAAVLMTGAAEAQSPQAIFAPGDLVVTGFSPAPPSNP